MAITFNSIPLIINTPGQFAEFDPSRATKGITQLPHDVLLVGQMEATGIAEPAAVVTPRSPDEAAVLFGSKSQCYQMFKAYRAHDQLTPVHVVGLADSATGAAATGSITWTGAAIETREQTFYVAGRRVAVAVSTGMTAAELTTAAVAAFALEPDLPVLIAANATGGLDFTAVHKGQSGNQIFFGTSLIDGERNVGGLVFTVNAMSGGASEPDHEAVITAMAEDQYHTLAIATSDKTQLDLYVTELEDRWGPMRSIEGFAFVAKYDSPSNLKTFGNSFNSQVMNVVGAEASGLLPATWEVAAQAAAITALQAQVDPSRAMGGKVFAGSAAAARTTPRFKRAERETLLRNGVSTVLAAQDGRLTTERFITTYQLNGLGFADQSMKDLHTCRTLAALRYSLRTRIGVKFANFKLADNGSEVPGQPMVTPNIIKGELINLFQDWQSLGWVENFEQFKSELLVERDASDPNRVNAILPPDIINAFLVGAYSVQFIR